MTKTLADMTPEERQACVGMWCDGPNGRLVIYCRPNGYFIKYADVTNPNNRNHSDSERFDQLTPRFDLPRAWNQDGTPPKGKWCKRVLGNGRNQKSWVGEWEQTND